jgi:diguanylate cyclase (GGDEF)-like protein
MRLEDEQKELLAKFVETHRKAPREARGKFMVWETLNNPQATFVHTRMQHLRFEGSRADAEVLARAGLLDLSANSKGNPLFYVNPEGIEFYERTISGQAGALSRSTKELIPSTPDGTYSCPLCDGGASAKSLHDNSGALRSASQVDCRTCGRFDITEEQAVDSRALPSDRRALLSALTRNATERGETLELDTATVDRLLKTTSWPSLTAREDMLLKYVADHAEGLGYPVWLSHQKDYPLFFLRSEDEFSFLVTSLASSGMMRITKTSSLIAHELTGEAYKRLERASASDSVPPAPGREPDPVTGLLKREAFDLDLPSLVESAQRDGTPLAFVQVDADHFKKVNDTYGHPKGDEVLAGIGRCLRTAVSGKGSAYRTGGEEMTLLLPNHSLDEARAVGERARRGIAQAPIADVNVTISLGIAVMPEHATDARSLHKAADDALYDAKNRGRNQVRYSGEPEPNESSPREL